MSPLPVMFGVGIEGQTRSPATPANVKRAFCPGFSIAMGTLVPETIGPVWSGGTSYTVSVALPLYDPFGAKSSVYVPVERSATGSRNPPSGPAHPVDVGSANGP